MTTVAAVAERNATAIVDHIRNRGLPKEVAVIAIMTAITESGIRILANPYDPASMALPHDGVGFDHDSSGIYQQRPGWGPVQCRMNAQCSTDLFLNVLLSHNWQGELPWLAAQHVQISFDSTGENYHRNYDTAVHLVNALWIPNGDEMANVLGVIAHRKSDGSVWLFEGGFAHHIQDPKSLTDYVNSKVYVPVDLTDNEINARIKDSR